MTEGSLAQALALYEEQWITSLPSDEELDQLYTPSPRFERRMKRLFLHQQKPYYPYTNRAWKRVVLAMVLVLLLFAASMSVSAIREPIIRFVVEVYERFSSLFFQNAEDSDEWVTYRPTSLPKEFLFKSEELLAGITIQHYQNSVGAEIRLKQYQWSKVELQINTEGVARDDVEVNGNQGVFYHNAGVSNLIWSEGEYTFWLEANLTKSDLLGIAISVKKVE